MRRNILGRLLAGLLAVLLITGTAAAALADVLIEDKTRERKVLITVSEEVVIDDYETPLGIQVEDETYCVLHYILMLGIVIAGTIYAVVLVRDRKELVRLENSIRDERVIRT